MTPVVIRAVDWVPQRKNNARWLRKQTGGLIVWDCTHNGLDTFAAGLRAARGQGAIHLEDDIVLGPYFRERAERLIAEHDCLIQFWSARDADFTIGQRFEPARGFSGSLAFYLPGRLVGHVLEQFPVWRARHPSWNGFDWAMGWALQQLREQYLIAVPNLVQHCSWESAVNPNRPRRRGSLTWRDDGSSQAEGTDQEAG
jgi:hypothetical protein